MNAPVSSVLHEKDNLNGTDAALKLIGKEVSCTVSCCIQ